VLVRLSSKGQMIIPKPLRQALRLEAGTRLRIRLDGPRIIVEPEVTSPVAALFGKYRDANFLADLETEHREEIRDETTVRI
jgi:AbrB family looped-hinge helix DNA binding protein